MFVSNVNLNYLPDPAYPDKIALDSSIIAMVHSFSEFALLC